MKNAFRILLKHQKLLFCFLAIASTLLMFISIRNFQAPLAQGDHGRDLYAFWQTSQGATPYQDYWWCYGPLMPYYYGLAFKLFNPLIQVALLAELFLKLIAVLLSYLALSCFLKAGWAFLGASWLAAFMPHFPHTYNHAGGIAALLWTILNLWLYFKNADNKFLWLGFCSITITFFIKFNIGIYSLMGFLACAILWDLLRHNLRKNMHVYIYGLLLTIVVLLGAHLWFVRGLPTHYILQCFPFLGGYRQMAPEATLWPHVVAFAGQTFQQIISYQPFLILAILVSIFFIFGLLLLCDQKQRTENDKKTFFALGTASVFFVFCLHEHLASPMIYSKYWAEPFQILCLFLILGFMASKTPKIFQIALAVFILHMIGTRAMFQHQFIKFFKNYHQQFSIDQHRLYITNSSDWSATVQQTTRALKTLLKKEELFFALPYEPLYYFLTKKQSPTKELCFFDFMNIPLEQEQDVILNLETKRISYIVLSSRFDSPHEPNIGTFGKTYCPLLAAYFSKNFEIIESFGNWGRPVGWIDNHATKILRRKSFLTP